MARTVSESFPSKYFKADDLKGRRLSLTMQEVVDESIGHGADAAEKPVVYFKNHKKGLVLGKTTGDSIALVVGSESYDDWPGKVITLYPTTTRFQGKKVPCIRIVEPDETILDDPLSDDDLEATLTPSGKAS
jgi:hypothetical protein